MAKIGGVRYVKSMQRAGIKIKTSNGTLIKPNIKMCRNMLRTIEKDLTIVSINTITFLRN